MNTIEKTNSPRHARGFTLVELLVVIAVIALLIALLLPALAQARRRAMLVLCMANERMIGISVLSYGGDYKSWYPYRQLGNMGPGDAYSYQPFAIRDMWESGRDDRDLFKSFMTNIDLLLICPLSPVAKGISIDNTSRQVLITRELWFGAADDFLQAGSGMLKQDDRPKYTDAGGTKHTFNVLCSDLERDWSVANDLFVIDASHPDEYNSFTRTEIYDSSYVYSAWERFFADEASMDRGPTERNFLLDDGSVRSMRLNFRDPATVRVPFGSYYASNNWTVYAWLPPMN